MRHRPLNDFALVIANLVSSIEWEPDSGPDVGKLQADSDAAEQAVFDLFVSKGYSLVEARSIATMIINAIRNGR